MKRGLSMEEPPPQPSALPGAMQPPDHHTAPRLSVRDATCHLPVCPARVCRLPYHPYARQRSAPQGAEPRAVPRATRHSAARWSCHAVVAGHHPASAHGRDEPQRGRGTVGGLGDQAYEAEQGASPSPSPGRRARARPGQRGANVLLRVQLVLGRVAWRRHRGSGPGQAPSKRPAHGVRPNIATGLFNACGHRQRPLGQTLRGY